MSNLGNTKEYLLLDKLEVYVKARELGKIVWRIYGKLSWEEKKIGGLQFIDSTDSVGANIAEGYGRFHYLDKAKFYYNARGSLLESKHWLEILYERGKMGKEDKNGYIKCYISLRPLLNGLIRFAVRQKNS